MADGSRPDGGKIGRSKKLLFQAAKRTDVIYRVRQFRRYAWFDLARPYTREFTLGTCIFFRHRIRTPTTSAKGGYGVMEKSVDVRFFACGVTQHSH